MDRKLAIRDLQILELSLAVLNYEHKFDFRFIVKDDDLLLSGNFFLYDKEKNPGIRKPSGQMKPYKIDDLTYILNGGLLTCITKHFSLRGRENEAERCNLALSHLPEYLKYCDKEDLFNKCAKNSGLSVLDGDNQYMFNAEILNIPNSPKMEFYCLDKDKAYDLLSIINVLD